MSSKITLKIVVGWTKNALAKTPERKVVLPVFPWRNSLPLYIWRQNCSCNEIKLSAQHSVLHRKPDYFAVEEISNWKIHLFIWFNIRFDEKNENFWKNAKQNCHTSGFLMSNVKWNCTSVNSILRKLKIGWPLMLVAYPG